jgi:2-oxoglutarate/2-oxoacid ferredoxin oxidoreductase subunit alpha
MKKVFTFKIGGEAGFGIMSAGLMFSKVAVRSGYSVFNYVEYPSLVRGGHNVLQVSVSNAQVRSPRKTTDFLVALNQETIDLHKDELTNGAGIIYDKTKGMKIPSMPKKINAFSIPIKDLAVETADNVLMENTVALGATIGLLGGNLQHLKDLIKEAFKNKDPKITEKNFRACQAGYDYAVSNYKEGIVYALKPGPAKKQIILSANESVALGAIASGLQFAAIYPMTPISNVLHNLAPLQEKYNFIYEQPEDEISGINMAIGASFAGARSMVATSGGGFALMVEAFGLAGATETPLVVVEGMRAGPATGLPTWSEQGDLNFLLHAAHGDFPRIILAPGDAEETFYLTMGAFNLAEKYQTPVILIVDKHIAEGPASFSPFKTDGYSINRGKLTIKKKADYLRYKLSKDGISERSVPGSGNYFISNSDEHDEKGFSDESAENRIQQMKKRMEKLQTCAKEDMAKPKLFGPKKAKTTLVSWGSNKGAILDAIEDIKDVNFLHITWLSPFPAKEVKKILSGAKKIIGIENNYSGQFLRLLKEQTGIEVTSRLLKYDGRPIFPEEIIKKIKS